jgi:hypothetical protein
MKILIAQDEEDETESALDLAEEKRKGDGNRRIDVSATCHVREVVKAGHRPYTSVDKRTRWVPGDRRGTRGLRGLRHWQRC